MLEEHLAKLKEIAADCQSPTNIVNKLLMKSEVVLEYASETNRQILELQLDELKSSVEEVAERSTVTIDEIEKAMDVTCSFQKTYAELKAWIETEENSLEVYFVDADVPFPKTALEVLKAKQPEIESKEKEIKELARKGARIPNLDSDGNESNESRVLALEMSCLELKSKITGKLVSLEGQRWKVEEFETEFQHCREIVQEIENVVTSDTPSFTNIESMETYVEELKGNFQDALAQRCALLQLGEKSDQALSVTDAERKHDELVDKWKTLLARFSAKIAEMERKIAEEKELNESFEEVAGWMDIVERELATSFDSQQAHEVEDVIAQVEKLKEFNSKCTSYEQFVASLRSKVEDSEDSSTTALGGNKDRVISLEARVEKMHKNVSSKLKDVEQCITDVSEVKQRTSSIKEWLLKNRELTVANEQTDQEGDVRKLSKNLDKFQKLNDEGAIVLNDILQTRDRIGESVGKVSSSLEESLDMELNSLCDSLRSVIEDSSVKSKELEERLNEAREFETEITRHERFVWEADSILHMSKDKSESIAALRAELGELRDLHTDINKKKEEFQSFLVAWKDFVSQSGVQERVDKDHEDFRKVIMEIEQTINDFEGKIADCMQCNEELEEAIDWLNKCAAALDSSEAHSLDCTSAHEQLAKVKVLTTELKSFEFKLSSLQQNGKILHFDGDDGVSSLQEKLDSVTTKWKLLCDSASVKESALLTFVEAQKNYKSIMAECKHVLEDLKKLSKDQDVYSAVPEKYTAQLERWKTQQEQCKELKEKIRAMEQAGDHMAGTCEAFRVRFREEVSQIKDDCQKVNMEAEVGQEQLENWFYEVGRAREEMELSLGRVKMIQKSLPSSELHASDIPTANNVLGQLKQLASDLDVEKQNAVIVLNKEDVVLAKLNESEKKEWGEAFRALQNAVNEAQEQSSEKVRKAEERINDIIEFDKESARCESLLTIYQAAVPVDLSCTVETMEDQMAKLKRLYSDMESRESQMKALHEKESKLCSDGSLDGKIGKLQGDWGKLRASVGEKLRELERLSQAKKELEHELDICAGGVQQLERALRESRSLEESVDARIHRMHELCATINTYRDNLDQLSSRCHELPIIAYEQNDLDPREKLRGVVKRLEEVNGDALGKLVELENEKTEMQNLAKEISRLRSWMKDACTPYVSKGIPSVVQGKELEKALLDNTEFSSLLSANCECLSKLLAKIRNVNGNAKAKELLLDDVREISRNLEDAQIKTRKNDSEIKKSLQQYALLNSDINHVKVSLMEVKTSQSYKAVDVEDDNWIKSRISYQKVELAKIESCEQMLSSLSTQIAAFSVKQSGSGQSAIEQDVQELTAEVHTVRQQLVNEISQLEKLSNFTDMCTELLTFSASLTAKIRAVDVLSIAQEANVTYTEQELAKCRSIDRTFAERDGDFKALFEKGQEILTFAPGDRKFESEERYHQLNENRTALTELIRDRMEALRNLVADQQTLEGWLKKARLLIEEAATFLRENEASLMLDEPRISGHCQTLEALITMLEEYKTYSETFQDSAKAVEVKEINIKMMELKNTLVTHQNKLQVFQKQYQAFQTEAMEAERIFERCKAEHYSPSSLQEAEQMSAHVEVTFYHLLSLISY